jgi:N-acetyl-anhydromuramyl-L-alanine amidase AmpD
MVLAKDLVLKEKRDLDWHRANERIIEGEYLSIPVLKFHDNEHSGFYYASRTQKTGVCLHYTEGYLGGDLSFLSRHNYRVSVPFLIARGGQIIQLWNPDFWSYHLGQSAIGGNERGSRALIPIEISSVGHLSKSGNRIFTYWGAEYCKASDTQYYEDLGVSYRGERYFATFSDEQYKALDTLLDALCSEYNIPRIYLDESKRYIPFESSAAAKSFKGISTHVNYRPTGKRDVGPAFDWSRI